MTEHRPSTAVAAGVAVLAAALLGGGLLLHAWEWGWQRFGGRSAVPATRMERGAIVLHLGVWAGCTAAMGGAAYGLWRRRAARQLSITPAAAAAAGLLVCTATLDALGTNDVARLALLAGATYVICRAAAAPLRRMGRMPGVLPVALATWAASNVVIVEPLRSLLIPTAGALGLAGTLLLGTSRRSASPLRRSLAALLLASPILLELIRCDFEPLAGLLAALAYCAGTGRPAGGTANAGRLWGLATAAACLLAWSAARVPSEDLLFRFLAGLALTVAVHSAVRRGVAHGVERFLGIVPRCRAAFVALAVVLLFALPPLVAVVLGLALACWQRLDSAEAAGATAFDSSTRRRRGTIVWGMAAGAVLARCLFWALTDRVWEDALITIQHAENAAAGLGLTHHPAHGRVHGFTSAASVLIPLAGEWLHSGAALLALRLSSLIAAAGTVLGAARLADHPSLRLPNSTLALWLAYLAFDHSQIAFGMAGMETQVWTCVLVAGACALAYRRPIWLGLALAAALWCRPDAAVWIGVCSLAALSFGWRRASLSLGTAALAIAPWLVFSGLYYGSITPNTVRAKSAGYVWHAELATRPAGFSQFVIDDLRTGMPLVSAILTPNFRGHGRGPLPTVPGSELVLRILLILGAMGVVHTLCRELWPIPLFVGAYLVYLLVIVQYWFAWYPIAVLGLAGLLGATGLAALSRFGRWPPVWQWTAASLLIACYVCPLPWTFAAEAQVQALVEEKVRRRVGEWLKEHAPPDEFVTAECLGYLGYYSRLPFHDYPGLASRRVVEVVRAHPPAERSLGLVVRELRPSWLVLRPHERDCATPDYDEVAVIALSPEDRAALTRFLPLDTLDDAFHVYRRKASIADRSR